MIKIFLVEDEMIIRRGIKNSIEWEKEGYQFAGEASDGELALPMILREKPDIVLTDIKMPFMDGLELSRLIRKELPETKILILSGYDEFEYAKEAIRIGITDYLLKPVSSTRLLEALDDVRRKIEQEKEEKALLIQYQKEMQENMEHEKEKFLNVLLNGTMSVGDAIRQASQYRLNLTAGMYNFLLFKIWTDDRQEDESSGIVDAFNNIETAADHMPGICRFQRGIEGWAFLLTGEDMEELTQKEEILTAKLKETMSRYPGLEYFGGIGRQVQRMRELQTSFRTAEYAFSRRFVEEPDQILRKEDQARRNSGLEGITDLGSMERNRGMLEKYLRNGTQEELGSFLQTYFESIPASNMNSILMRQYIAMDFYVITAAFSEKMNLSREKLKEKSERLKCAISETAPVEKIKQLIYDYVWCILSLRDQAGGRQYSDIIRAAKHYIEENYMSEEVSLNTVSASVNMSPSYFSSVFSKESGKTFVEYLTEVRMEKAKEMLMCSSLKTSEIGYEVGYKDPHYFSYIFKKTQGCSPKEYRQRRKAQI